MMWLKEKQMALLATLGVMIVILGFTGNAWCDDSNLDSSVVLIFANEISSFL